MFNYLIAGKCRTKKISFNGKKKERETKFLKILKMDCEAPGPRSAPCVTLQQWGPLKP